MSSAPAKKWQPYGGYDPKNRGAPPASSSAPAYAPAAAAPAAASTGNKPGDGADVTMEGAAAEEAAAQEPAAEEPVAAEPAAEAAAEEPPAVSAEEGVPPEQ